LDSSDLVRQSRDWLGVPFRHQGRSRYGVDCVGLVVCVFGELGVTLKDDRVYRREVSPERLFQVSGQDFKPVTAPTAGDIMVYKVTGYPTPHVAINAGETIIHAFYKHGKVVEQVPWSRGPIQLERVFRFNG